jgi:GTP1/Obg family GTP-binding protein
VQQDVRKNYISIVNDAPDHEQAASTMKDFVGRLATVLKRRLPAAPGPTITP